jgi:putative ribosome biogenesis GTPase RsgA
MDRVKNYENKLRGKDVTIMIGMTGAGKSLTINFLKGNFYINNNYIFLYRFENC